MLSSRSLLSCEPGEPRGYHGRRQGPRVHDYAVASRQHRGEPGPSTELAFVPIGNHSFSFPRSESATAFASLEELRRDAAYAAGRSTSVVDADAERIPVGQARKRLGCEQARVAALEERLCILTHHLSTSGRETERANHQVKAAAALAGMHPRGSEHHGRTLAAYYVTQHAELTEVRTVLGGSQLSLSNLQC